ncbi:6074_t:CDS:2, partial [Paraglomus occultum]
NALEDELTNLQLSYQLTQKHTKVAANTKTMMIMLTMQLLSAGNSQPGSPKYLSSIKEEDEAKLLGHQTSDSFPLLMLMQTIEKLKKRLQQRENDIQKLEGKLKAAEAQNENVVKLGHKLGSHNNTFFN